MTLNLKNREIIIPPEIIEMIKKFAKDAAPYHNDTYRPRTLEEREYDIFIGKLGEEILYRILSPYFNISPVKYITHKDKTGDGGIDLIYNDTINIDVKTLHKSHHSMRPINDIKCDLYSLVILNESKTGGKYIGTITKKELMKFKKYSVQQKCSYVDKRVFEQSNSWEIF